jgi:hypothetical protein
MRGVMARTAVRYLFWQRDRIAAWGSPHRAAAAPVRRDGDGGEQERRHRAALGVPHGQNGRGRHSLEGVCGCFLRAIFAIAVSYLVWFNWRFVVVRAMWPGRRLQVVRCEGCRLCVAKVAGCAFEALNNSRRPMQYPTQYTTTDC